MHVTSCLGMRCPQQTSARGLLRTLVFSPHHPAPKILVPFSHRRLSLQPSSQSPKSPSNRPLKISPQNPPPQHITVRSESTSASDAAAPTPTTPPLPASTSTSSSPPPQTLTWNRFLSLRAVRRRFNLVSSIATAALTMSAGVYVIGQQDLDKISGAMLFGLDPFIVLGMVTFGCGAVGWLMGPFVGGGAFGMIYKGVSGEFKAKERDFYRRIYRYRVDPSSQSFSNPVPDYYGEKVSSVQGYRQWLRDQRAFNKKRESFV